jgi:hypothetical protein
MLLCSIVVSVFICAKYNSLADKTKGIRATTEASMSGIKIVYAAKRSDRSVVISSIIEYEVT